MGIAKPRLSVTPRKLCVCGDKALAEGRNPQVAEPAAVASEPGSGPAGHDPGFDLYSVGYELVALNSVVADLGAIAAAIAPGTLERALAETRLRLQTIITNRIAPVDEGEDLVLRFRISLLERILGRTQSQF